MQKLSMSEQMTLVIEGWRAIDTIYEQYAKSKGLTLMAFTVLETLYDTPDSCTQKFICEQTHFPKQSVNAVIRFLWRKGYVQMREIDADRRNKAVWLTESGRVYATDAFLKLRETEENVMSQLSYEQRQTMIDITTSIRSALESML